MSSTKHRSRGNILGLTLASVSLITAGLLFLNRQYVLDQINVWQYQPNSQVQTFVDRSDMNQTGKFYFYASRPVVEDSTQFNKDCDKKESNTAILGCYTSQRIFIYNVTDKRLDGIRSVTAAHEMLHAAYERLSDAEHRHIDTLIEAEYQKLKSDKKLAERMKFYDRTEPGQRDNELHSVIATEVADISPELETYYKKYFDDRKKVVDLHAQYEKVFDALQTRADELSSQLKTLHDSIEADITKYNTDLALFDKNKAGLADDFNSRANNGGFDSQSEFQAERAALIARMTAKANTLDATRRSIEDDIKEYNSLQHELAGIASQNEALNRSINSSLAPAPSL